MKVDFIGGDDVQRSLNHSDNRCVNLVPSLNDKGDIAAFYNAPGLSLEATNPSAQVGSGIYTASNGRCFEVAGTTLYEITSVAGVITTTSRGTITSASISRMIDNGIDLMIVNGVDGWLFTFSTNTLKKIKVKQADFTVTIADPAVFTSVGHTLEAGDPIRLTSTTGSILSDSVLSALTPSTAAASSMPLGVAVAPANDFVYVADSPSTVLMYSRDTASGLLSPLSPPSVPVGFARDIKITSDGISLYVGCLNVFYIFGVNVSTGQLTAGTPAYITPAVGAGIINVVLSSDDAFFYATSNTLNTIYQYSRNLGTGELTALTPSSIACAGGPREMVISADGLFAYVACETSNLIRVFARNATTGLLSAATPASISCGGLSPTGLALSPDANNPHLYVVNSGSATVAMFSRNSTTGALTALSTATVSTGTSPQKISCTTESVYVTNSSSNTVSQFSRDSSTGILTVLSTPTIATGNVPIGIVTAPDGNSVYVCNSGSATISQYSRSATGVDVGLPTGLEELTTYYVITTGLTADAFEVSETVGGTAVSTSGQQAGVHTFTTLGYGFPEGAKTISYMNGRFAALEPSTQNFYVSEVLDGTWWDALNVQTVDANPDYNVGSATAHQEFIVWGKNSGQVYYDSGAYPTPWVPNPSGVFEVGCSAEYSIASIDNTVFWLGGNQTGDGMVWKMQGFTPVRVSTHSIEYAIQAMSDISDARAFTYQQDGHNFYVLTFPTGDKTYVYDINTGLWHERANFAGGSFSRWAAQEHAYFAGKHLVLDHTEGKIYSLSNSVYTYGTEDRKWLRSFRVPTANMNRERHTRLQLDCEAGVGLVGGTEPTVMLKWSDDGGHTWSNEVWRSMGIGSIGEYNKRVVWHRLGMTTGQPRIYELSGTADVKTVLLNVYLD